MAIIDGEQAQGGALGSSGALVTVYGGEKAPPSFDEGVAEGFAQGIRPEVIRAVRNRPSTFVGKNTSGQPDASLTPGWVVYLDAVTNTPQAAPVITNLGNGNFKFIPTGTNPAGLLDLGATALPRYLVHSALSTVWVFGVFDLAGQPLTGLTPTWVSLKKQDGTNYTPQPAISELAGGLYKTAFLDERVSGVIDAGSTANPRYIPYSNDRGTVLIPISSEV